MSKIEKLIETLCPDGVEYKELWAITNWDKRFNGVEHDKQVNILKFNHVSAEKLKELKVINGDIKLLSTGKFEGYSTEDISKDCVNEGEVITLPSGGAANIKYYNGKFVDSGNLLASSRNNQLYSLKFIYYYLLKEIIKNRKQK